MGGITFRPGLTQAEINRFAALVGKDTAIFTAQGDLNEVLAKENILHIELHRALLVDKKAGKGGLKEGKEEGRRNILGRRQHGKRARTGRAS